MNSNVKLDLLLRSWFYNDIIKIILSYKTFDYDELLMNEHIDIKCYDIVVIGKKLYIECSDGNSYNYPKYFNLSSKKNIN